MARDIVVIGASAGGLEALTRMVSVLPADFPGSLFVVLHVPPTCRSALPEILSRAGPLPAAHARSAERIEPARIYVAPPDQHLLLRRGIVQLVRGPKENRHRPAADPMFRSAALFYGRRVVGVVLSGALDDGSAGLLAIANAGGVTIVQHPEEAAYPDMPRNAAESVRVDYCLPAIEIGNLLARIVNEPSGPAIEGRTDAGPS